MSKRADASIEESGQALGAKGATSAGEGGAPAGQWWHLTLSTKTQGSRRRNYKGALFVAGTPQRIRLTPAEKAALEESGEWTFRHAADPVDTGSLGQRPTRPPLAPPPDPPPSSDPEPVTEE